MLPVPGKQPEDVAEVVDDEENEEGRTKDGGG